MPQPNLPRLHDYIGVANKVVSLLERERLMPSEARFVIDLVKHSLDYWKRPGTETSGSAGANPYDAIDLPKPELLKPSPRS